MFKIPNIKKPHSPKREVGFKFQTLITLHFADLGRAYEGKILKIGMNVKGKFI